MANVGPLQIFSDLSQVKTFPDLVRFLSAFTAQVSTQFNNLISNRTVYGYVSASGIVGIGSGNFGVSLIGTGRYFIRPREPWFTYPAVTVTPNAGVDLSAVAASLGNTGFLVYIYSAGSLTSCAFSFNATGARNG